MAIIQNATPTGALPYGDITHTTEQTQQNQTGGNVQNEANLNTFTDAQRAMQSQVLGSLSGTLSGQSIPSTFGLPQATWDAAIANFNRYQLPIAMAQHGPGSGAGAAQLENLILQLAGISGQNAMQNYQGLTGQAGNLAFNPVGNTANRTNQNQAQTNINRTLDQTNIGWDPGATLFSLSQFLGGGGGGNPVPGTGQNVSGQLANGGSVSSPFGPVLYNPGVPAAAPTMFPGGLAPSTATSPFPQQFPQPGA